MIHHRKTRRDITHGPIVRALEGIGATVVDLSTLGEGKPDLIVGYRGVDRMMEVKSERENVRKDGYLRTDKGAVQENQAAFAASWRGAPVIVVRSVGEALAAVGVTT